MGWIELDREDLEDDGDLDFLTRQRALRDDDGIDFNGFASDDLDE